ncbi:MULTISPECIES: DUF3618 domain-containing protein [unclassified Pseudomonas]|uniref:DUF3618 domain-containing protein n=1 Tax=unclassified Pseudomonas TaxID=196821 RepID=UPI0011A9CCF1|nr:MULTISPECIES: DUF3618 domain-containing protein [unclassified Pseudomonas]MBU0521488.1 DUF3618 domain-containing protein [Gammaproteobacteria bacterium]MBU0822423.1 DUF3618 domain-containing protein [Gammaproteobacteria bacterium]MBU0841050.1 DUF3618 domain-containing protein [Gammaproteobacteria bacterium]MBU1841919.1 DUF3618 domain-containing protein [Gammaproteobacteria bacterium]TWC12435.1 uncharacterized protein DUF3618 [Pseudomonas sp. SJZ083]
MNSEFDIEAGKSPEAIEREIDAQRASIGNIVDALESKFTPGQMFDQALTMMQSNGTTFLTNLGTSVRNNPVPAVLTSVGLLWLMMSQNRPPSPRPGYRVGPDQNKVGEWTDGLADGIDSARDHLHQTADTLKDGYQTIKGKAAHMGDNLGAATDTISHAVHDASDRLVRSSQVLGTQFSQLLKEQPLMVAAAGIALGAMLGAALPSTATEQRYMGKTSAGLADKVKQQAREGFEAVRDTVTKTTDHSDVETKPQGEYHAASDTPADLSRGLGTS